MTNYALADAAGIFAAFVLFSALSFFPGYLIGYLLNLWQFRSRTFSFQLAASVPLSLSIGPIVTFLLGLVTNWTCVWLVYLGVAVASLWLLVRSKPHLDNTAKKAFLVGIAWILFAAVWVMDWQFSSRVYFPVYAFDNATRAAFIHSLAFFGLPAQTPFVNPGHPVALHYHFLWFLQCSLVHWLAPLLIPARIALIAGAIWCGLGLMCVSALAMRIIMQRRSWMVILLLSLTGFDFVPTFTGLLVTRMHLFGLLHTTLWQPHYGCALIACLTALLLLWQSRSLAIACVASLCFATAVGSGTFIALVFAAFLTLWILLHLRTSLPLAFAGALTIVLSLPYLITLRAPSQNVGGPSLFHLIPSPFSPIQMPFVLKILELPLYYFLEFGFLAVCAIVGYRRKLVPGERMFALMALASILICSFVESAATPNNDLGWRGFMVTQFSLTILAAAYLANVRPSAFLKVLLLVGLLGTSYDLFVNRFFPILADIHQGPKPEWLGHDQMLGDRTFANREAYSWLQRHSARTATVGQNPDVPAVDIFSGQYGDRRIAAGDRNCTAGFGGTPAECTPIAALLSKLFAGQVDFAEATPNLPAALYIVKDTDPVWLQPRSWVWTRTPVFANQFVRIFACARSNNGTS